jgi:hypothetical protein
MTDGGRGRSRSRGGRAGRSTRGGRSGGQWRPPVSTQQGSCPSSSSLLSSSSTTPSMHSSSLPSTSSAPPPISAPRSDVAAPTHGSDAAVTSDSDVGGPRLVDSRTILRPGITHFE